MNTGVLEELQDSLVSWYLPDDMAPHPASEQPSVSLALRTSNLTKPKHYETRMGQEKHNVQQDLYFDSS
jgi:hypothetical protein